ncbi:MAG: bacterial/archaeal transporter family protein [Thermococcaceae archaeon]|uniref:EamA family transporter n=1 Tax=Thermococcus TaxID=2263 RepID=UPI000A043C5D|nr:MULTISPECIES: EamA family transporter [Thermococcus]MDK2782646.1 bacterial/archaeal transporter family protein [Thermococcaceae archaeon]MDK2854059.1 bacterial/archaeal transporter family protein [Thermococcaceae archaeon]MDK2983584.1 bacterial/archaeal transporter family protein [Thermococcaceae archaeon]MDN5320763.1 bacterial/archaeal transporter family protein [Thermococcaceae archaeon]
MEIPIYIFYALLSAIFAALVAIFGKIGLEGIDSTLATTIRAFIMFMFLLLVSAFQGKLKGGITSRQFVFIVLSGIAGALSWLFYFLALKTGSVKAVVAIDRTSVVFAIAFAWLLLGEEVTLRAFIGALLIVIGAILVSLK